MKHLATLLLSSLIGCAAPDRNLADAWQEPVAEFEPINFTCPRSGKPVASDSLTEYRGYVVGFCNRHCRDDFAAHGAERPHDASYFDAIIATLEER